MRLLGTGDNVWRNSSFDIFYFMLGLFSFPFTLHFITIVSSLFYSLVSLKSRVSTTSCLVQRQIPFCLNHWSSFPFLESSMLCYKRCILASLGAHSACQLSTIDIWKAREWATSSFHSVQRGAVQVGNSTRYILWVTINANEVTWMLESVMLSHQVPMILLGPSRWTVIPCGHHQHWATWLDETDNAESFVIVNVSLKRVSVVLTVVILSPIHECLSLNSFFVLVILWIVRKTKVVRSTTRMVVPLSAHYT